MASLTAVMVVLTVIGMQRGRSKAVTDDTVLAVLIPAPRRHKQGVATFSQVDESPQPVRLFRTSDLKDAKKHLSHEDAERFNAIAFLKKALESPADPIAVEKALRALQPLSPQPYGPKNPLGDLYPVMTVISQQLYREKIFLPTAWMKQLADAYGVEDSPYAKADPRVLLSYVLSNELREARLVLWWTSGKFRPALWCPAMKVAFYARFLLGVVGGQGFAVCPHCGKWFVQDRSDQTYCSVSHREAHRVARWRAQQKLKASTRPSGRRKNVTREKR